MDSLDEPPAKRRKPSPREIGVMRKSSVDNSATFLGSSSGVHFIRIVYDAFARRSAHLNLNQSQTTTLVPGEDDQLASSPLADVSAVKNELWMPHELDHRPTTTTGKVKPPFDHLVQWTRSYFDHWHPILPFFLGPPFLAILEKISLVGLNGISTSEVILVRSVVSISLMDRRQMSARGKQSPSAPPPVPAALVFRTVAQAMESLHALFCDPPTIAILQAAFGVELFLASALRLNAASRIAGVITRTAFHLGLHRCPARFPCFGPNDQTLRRRLFWSIYCLERYLSQALGIPLGIRDDDVDVCYPGMERHGEVVDDPRLHLITHLARFSRVRGLVIELRNKSILHSQESSITATQVTGELTHWWNQVYDDVYPGDEDTTATATPRLAPLHRLLLTVLRHESIISLNRPLLAAESSSPEYRTALQICIESSRSLLTALRGAEAPLVWPSFTWGVWMSCLILVYAAWEGEFPIPAAARYAQTGLSILQNLSRRGSTWPQTCIEAIRALEAALSEQPPDFSSSSHHLQVSPAYAMQHALQATPTHALHPPGTPNQHLHVLPSPQSALHHAGYAGTAAANQAVGEASQTQPPPGLDIEGPTVEQSIFGEAALGIPNSSDGGPFLGDVENLDLWSVADGPWLIQESYDGSSFQLFMG